MEKELSSQQKYYLRNRDILRQKAREKYHNNKEEICKYKKEYYKNNKETRLEYQRNYYKSPEKYKQKIITTWKNRNLKSDDYDKLYEYYNSVNNCELCNCELTNGRGLKGKRHLDHDHTTGEVRNVLCGSCNINLHKIKLKSSTIINEESGHSE
jgi:hypothetical protein